ncbi:MAG: hypothetical protein AAF741_00635 [Bacteroidota bacterium]
MTDAAIKQGFYLAELRQHYHSYRDPFLQWLSVTSLDQERKIDVFRRSLLAWYEARLRRRNPYEGDTGLYLQVAAIYFLEGAVDGSETERLLAADVPDQDPRDFMPMTIRLDDTQALMYQQMESWNSPCKDLLMAAYYHGIGDDSLAEAYELSDRESSRERRLACLQGVREMWTSAGLLSAQYRATPEQQILVDEYMRNELDTESRWEVDNLKATEPAVRQAIQRREDWAKAMRVLGRKDTLEILEKEEQVYHRSVEKARIKSLDLPKYRLPKVGLNVQNILIGALTILLGIMLYQTFLGGTRSSKLFDRYYQPLAAPRDLNPTDIDQQELLEMLEPYRRGQYQEAYNELLPGAQAYDEAPLYLGVIALELEQPQRALQWFRKVDSESGYYETASWYRVLAHLQAGNTVSAESEAIDIAGRPDHMFARNAAQLLDEF